MKVYESIRNYESIIGCHTSHAFYKIFGHFSSFETLNANVKVKCKRKSSDGNECDISWLKCSLGDDLQIVQYHNRIVRTFDCSLLEHIIWKQQS